MKSTILILFQENQAMSIFGELSEQQFLAQYWQKKPLVIRQAFPNIKMPFSAEELAGLSIDEELPARIVIEQPRGRWQAKYPPFSDKDFTSLPDTHWTLLVNDIERYVPQLSKFIQPFRFIPDWRIDDLMISYAANQGSVGPHLDQYDVFLIQAEGKRRWKIVTDPNFPTAIIDDLPLAILKEFNADQEYLLEAGDMLYLPPNMPHYGIAEGDCMTLSVGFRAPNQQTLIQGWLASFIDDKDCFFQDPNRPLQPSSGEISATDLNDLKKLMLARIEAEKEHLSRWLGCALTEGINEAQYNQLEQPLTFIENLDYQRESGCRFAYLIEQDILYFFASGQDYQLPLNALKVVQYLCEAEIYQAQELALLMQTDGVLDLFNKLLKQGVVIPLE